MIVDMNTGQPNFSATPQNPDLLRWVGIQVAVVVLAWLIGMIVRRFPALIRLLTFPCCANDDVHCLGNLDRHAWCVGWTALCRLDFLKL